MDILQTVVNYVLNDLGAAVFVPPLNVDYRASYEDEISPRLSIQR